MYALHRNMCDSDQKLAVRRFQKESRKMNWERRSFPKVLASCLSCSLFRFRVPAERKKQPSQEQNSGSQTEQNFDSGDPSDRRQKL